MIGRVAPVSLPGFEPATIVARGARKVWHRGGYVDATIYARADLGRGAELSGPAIIEQADTTTFVLPGWHAHADRLGTLHLMRGAKA